MKIRHNKKRNTAFVFESLIREATLAILKNDLERKSKVIKIVREHFKPDSALRSDLNCYRSLYTNQNLNKQISEKILKETKLQRALLNHDKIFDEQTELIDTINKDLSPSIFSNFVPNYKALATISQLFSNKVSPKNKVLLEAKIVSDMSLASRDAMPNNPIDQTVYNLFAKKFNDKYDKVLLEEQKELLKLYVSSFSDSALALKVFLNEEIARLKEELKKAKNVEEVSADHDMLKKTQLVIEKLNSFSKQALSEELLFTIMKTQSLVKEITTDADNN
jgi:hypothetical protein